MRNSVRQTLAAVVLGAAVLTTAASAADAQGKSGAAGSAVDLEEARRLLLQAVELKEAGKYDAALLLSERALAIREGALGHDHIDVAESLDNLATLCMEKGDHARAEPAYERALAIREKVLGSAHPDVATSLNNLALLYKYKGEYTRAEPLLERARDVWVKALGPDDPLVATALYNLASLYTQNGRDPRAAPLFRHALALREKALGQEHPLVAITLNALAKTYLDDGDHALAESLCKRAMAIQEKAYGPDHPAVAVTLASLALVYLDNGEYSRAEPLMQRALTIREKALGSNHPFVAYSLNGLAMVYWANGDHARAEDLMQRALTILETALGPSSPLVSHELYNLSALNEARQQYPRAIAFAQRAAEIREQYLLLLLATGTESEKHAYLVNIDGELRHSVRLAVRTGDRQATDIALTTLLRRKGRALDATTGGMGALRSRLDATAQKLFDELLAVRSKRSTQMVRGPGAMPPRPYQDALNDLEEQDQKLQRVISERSAAFRAAEQPITVAAVQAALPQGSALVEWSVYQPSKPTAGVRRAALDPARYAACVLPRAGERACVDLGEVTSIDGSITQLRRALSRAAGEHVNDLARELDVRVMAPVRKLLGPIRRVYLSPDGALNLIPFASLVDESGRPLIESYSFTYLSSGRDLLRLADRTARPREGPTVFAFPDFDASGITALAEDTKSGGDRGARSLDLATMTFHRLPGTEGEAHSVVAALGPARVLVGSEASERAFKSLQGPSVLHIATHGFFLPDQPGRAEVPRAGREALGAGAPAVSEDPMVRSGLALAGANLRSSGGDDGILTALEVSGTDLHGTELVVLSACETAVGDVINADGVYGLRRALVLAGARTQVMSLWKVEDAATAELMKAYYEKLAGGGGRSEAMRHVQLAMLHDGRHEHPYYWAAFIVSGDDSLLDDKPIVPDLHVHPGGACACELGDQAPANGAAWLGVAAVVALGLVRRRSRGRRQSTGARMPPARVRSRNRFTGTRGAIASAWTPAVINRRLPGAPRA